MELLVAKHPDDPSKRVVAPIKSNISREATGLVYRITDGGLEWLTEPVPFEADELESGEAIEQADALGEAMEWLSQTLLQGPRASRELLREAGEEGISASTLKRAKRRLGAGARKRRGSENSVWEWFLVDGEGEQIQEDQEDRS